MKMNKKLMMGVSAILIAFTGSTLATQKNPINWVKCQYCNARPGKCAKDEKFFDKCMTSCPPTVKGDPIGKCRTAHYEATSPKTLASITGASCENKKKLIELQAAIANALPHTKPYSPKEEQYILKGCFKEQHMPSNEAEAMIPPPPPEPETPPVLPKRPSSPSKLPATPRPHRLSKVPAISAQPSHELPIGQGGVLPAPSLDEPTTPDAPSLEADVPPPPSHAPSQKPKATSSAPTEQPEDLMAAIKARQNNPLAGLRKVQPGQNPPTNQKKQGLQASLQSSLQKYRSHVAPEADEGEEADADWD